MMTIERIAQLTELGKRTREWAVAIAECNAANAVYYEPTVDAQRALVAKYREAATAKRKAVSEVSGALT